MKAISKKKDELYSRYNKLRRSILQCRIEIDFPYLRKRFPFLHIQKVLSFLPAQFYSDVDYYPLMFYLQCQGYSQRYFKFLCLFTFPTCFYFCFKLLLSVSQRQKYKEVASQAPFLLYSSFLTQLKRCSFIYF